MVRKLTVHLGHSDLGHVARRAMIGATRAGRSQLCWGSDLVMAKMAGQALTVVESGVSLKGSVWIMAGHTGETRIPRLAPTPAFLQAIRLKANDFDAALRGS